jgi:hypothetical protein
MAEELLSKWSTDDTDTIHMQVSRSPLPSIREVLGLYFGPETGYPDYELRGFPRFLYANAGIL